MQCVQLLLVASLGVLLVSSTPVQEKRLIKTSETDPGKWMDETQVWFLIHNHINFIDVTDQKFPDVKAEDIQAKAIPTSLKYQAKVKELLTSINPTRIETFLRAFSSYHTRYYTSTTGIESQKWLLEQVRSSVVGYVGTVSVTEFTHSWAQSSIVAKIVGSDPTLRSEVVVVGAHQDSVNIAGSTRNAPGADDNASGSVVVLETLRILVQNEFVPKRTVEFHWYAAEEVGLRGSAAIATKYRADGVNVVSMVNFDVPGYHVQGRDEIGIYTDNGNAALTQFMRVLVDGYCTYTKTDRTCGYGCSDHASWTNNGFPATMPAEVVLHPQMHSVNDNMDGVGIPQVQEFAKLSLGYIVEMAEPSS